MHRKGLQKCRAACLTTASPDDTIQHNTTQEQHNKVFASKQCESAGRQMQCMAHLEVFLNEVNTVCRQAVNQPAELARCKEASNSAHSFCVYVPAETCTKETNNHALAPP